MRYSGTPMNGENLGPDSGGDKLIAMQAAGRRVGLEEIAERSEFQDRLVRCWDSCK